MSSAEVLRAFERAVELEALRTTVREAVRQNGQHLIAGLIGITRSVLRKFLAMSEPTPPSLARMREWCLDRPEPEVAPERVSLAVLAAGFPAEHRVWARRRFAHEFGEMYAQIGVSPPDWVKQELVDGPRDPGTPYEREIQSGVPPELRDPQSRSGPPNCPDPQA